MKCIVSYGGGITSVETLDRAIRRFGKNNVTAIFADVGQVRDRLGRVVDGEDDDLYRVMGDAEKLRGFNILRLTSKKYGPGIWSVFFRERMIGNSRVDPCSRHLKRKVLRTWIEENGNLKTDILATGLDWSEPTRMHDFKEAMNPWECWFPLADNPRQSKAQLILKWSQAGIDPPALYEEGFDHNNCGGMCVKAGHPQFFNLWKKKPWVYAHHESQEKLFGETISMHTVVKNHTMQQLRERFEAGYVPKPRAKPGCRGQCIVPIKGE